MSEAEIQIRVVTREDLDLLRTISIQTFTETFARDNSESDMQAYVSENLSIEKLQTEYTTIGSVFYVLEAGHDTIGYMKLNTEKAQTVEQQAHKLEIERIYVSANFHGKQLGTLLLNKAIAIAKEKHCPSIWLGVWEHNIKAISFYKKHGFVKTGSHVFKLGSDEQTDEIMELKLM